MKKLFILIFIFLILDFGLAQINPYFSIKNVPSGLMVGVEIINQKNNLVLNPGDYIYEWGFPDISLSPYKTNSNIFFISLNKYLNSLFIELKISKPFSSQVYDFKNNNLNLKLPKVKIIRKSDGSLLPLASQLNSNDYLTVITKNFFSKNLNYLWEFNNNFISNEKEISVNELKNKNGTIKVKVLGSFPWERAEDLIGINIE